MATKKTDELAKREETALAAPVAAGGRVEGLDEVLPEHVDIPMLVLVQAMTRDRGAAQVGDWVLRSTNRNYGSHIRMVPIAQFNSRGYFTKDQPAPMCTSLDGKVPFGGESPVDPKGKIHHDCATCYFAQRQPNPNDPKQRLPAPCAAQINFLAMVFGVDDGAEDGQLCRVRFKRTSWNCGRQIITNAQFSAARVKTLWGTTYEIATKAEKGKMGEYAVPIATVVPGPSEKHYPGIDGTARAYSTIWARLRDKLARASVEPEDGDAVDAAPHDEPPAAGSAKGAPPDDDLPF